MHPILTQFTTTVAFLVQKRKSDSQPIPMGSAFFVGVPRQEQPIEYVTYIVTARHNTEYADKSKKLYLRVNTTTGRFDDIKINHDDWISADRTDIAIMPIKLSDDVDCRFLPAQTLLTEQQVARRDIIREGSQIYIPSLFSRFYVPRSNVSYNAYRNDCFVTQRRRHCQFGSVQQTRVGKSVPYQCLSWGGCSGAPVFVNYVTPEILVGGPAPIHTRLLGLLSSHYDVPDSVDVDAEEFPTGVNSGIAVVIPAQHISDLLFREDVAEQRQDSLGSAELARRTQLPYRLNAINNFIAVP